MVEDWKESIGERLLALRMQKGMTQEELAEYLNVSRQSVSKWELNKTLPDVDKMVQLADLYGVSSRIQRVWIGSLNSIHLQM
jgi:transcriptional regulator with XRE-family HTH domain